MCISTKSQLSFTTLFRWPQNQQTQIKTHKTSILIEMKSNLSMNVGHNQSVSSTTTHKSKNLITQHIVNIRQDVIFQNRNVKVN